MTQVIFNDGQVTAVSPEGQKATMPVAALMAALQPPAITTAGIILPDGVKSGLSQGRYTVLVHQSSPQVCNFRWIAKGSPKRYGPGTKYRQVRIALPYLVVLAVFGPDERGRLQLGTRSECFFRNAPLKSLDDELYYPALLNCSKFATEEGHPLSWICVQFLDFKKFAGIEGLNDRVRVGMEELMHCLLETGFNYSSEDHEESSWYSLSVGVDRRISTVERWEKATKKDRLFVLDVPWISTGRTVRQVIERIFKNHHAGRRQVTSTRDVARIIFNSQKGR